MYSREIRSNTFLCETIKICKIMQNIFTYSTHMTHDDYYYWQLGPVSSHYDPGHFRQHIHIRCVCAHSAPGILFSLFVLAW